MAQTAAQKKATAAKDAIIMQKAMEARGKARQTAAAKEKTYVESLENPITSQYDPRIRLNAGYDPAKVGVMTGSEGMTLEEKATAVAASGKSTVVNTDALARLNMQLMAWGIGDLSDVITKLLQQGFDEDTVMSRMKYDNSPIDPNNPKGPKWNDAYTTRFAGNAARVAKGLNAYDERE